MRLDDYLNQRRADKTVLLMTHVVCGYPSFEANRQALDIMAGYDVDLVELQFPFSEPSADGPLFVKANQQSLESGTTIDQCFELLSDVSSNYSFKTLMMGYYNTVFSQGHEAFVDRLAEAGAWGHILPDLPLEEAGELHELSAQRDLAPVMLMTPANTEHRLRQIAAVAKGLVYAVARAGVTGTKTAMSDELAAFLARCRALTGLPLAVGFGISQAEDLEFIGQHADIAVIGSAALRAWEEGGADTLDAFFAGLTAIQS